MRVLLLALLFTASAAAQTGTYPQNQPIWGIYATGNGYPVFSPALAERAALEGIPEACLKTFTIAVMPSALTPADAANSALAQNLSLGLVEIIAQGLTRPGAQQRMNVVSPYRNSAIQCTPPRGPDGTWRSNHGTIRWQSGGRAVYGTGSGRIVFTLRGRIAEGYWIEDSTSPTCATAREGSRVWGRIRFEFDAAFQTFSGVWGTCDNEPRATWAGSVAD